MLSQIKHHRAGFWGGTTSDIMDLHRRTCPLEVHAPSSKAVGNPAETPK